jgi:DNA-binding transcriptional MerR regulator
MKSQTKKRLVKISELARLSGVPSPTIKHYMREGLLPGPAKRTSRNMAYYDADLAGRVKAIKNLQQKHFLPLKVIGDVLEPGSGTGIRKDLDDATRERLGALEPAIRAGQEESRMRRTIAKGPRRRTKTQVLEELDITEDELGLLEELGLAKARPGDDGEYYDDADLDIIEIINETREKNMGDLFPMSILEPYVACIRTLVRMELSLFRQRVLQGAELPELPLPEVAKNATQLGERLVVAMRSKLVFPELQALASGQLDNDDEDDEGDE